MEGKKLVKLNYSDVSFASAGWMYIYEFGVLCYILENFETNHVISHGTSAGALCAGALCMKYPIDISSDEIILAYEKAKNNFMHIISLVEDGIERLCPLDEDLIPRVNGRLNIVCTNRKTCFKFECIKFDKFIDREDLINLLKATCNIPIIGSYFGKRHKEYNLFDGALKERHPSVPVDSSLKITWNKDCKCKCTIDETQNTISPKIKLPDRWALIPPNDHILKLLFYHGYANADDFFKKKIKEKTETSSTILDQMAIDINIDNETYDQSSIISDKLNHLKNTPLKEIFEYSMLLKFARSEEGKNAITEDLSDFVNHSNAKWNCCICCGSLRMFLVGIFALFPFLLNIICFLHPFIAIDVRET